MGKRLVCVALCIAFLFCLSGCGSAAGNPAFEKGTSSAPLSDDLITENDNFSLSWDSENYGIVLTDKKTGRVFGSSPPDDGVERLDAFGMPVKRHEMVNSLLTVYYRNKTANTDNNIVYSYGGVVENGHIRCARIKNGVHVEFFFDSLEFMIPVDFVLYEDHLRVSINPKQIRENSNIITSISLAPFFCSAANDNSSARLFIPSGSGALASTENRSLQGDTFSAPVYGEDLAYERLYEPLPPTAVRLPVFGADFGAGGVFAVIDGAEESALVEAIIGGEAYVYSAVYPTFEVRGYTRHQMRLFTSATRTYLIYSDALISEEMGVNYYPLADGGSDYSSMASLYREYLKQNEGLKSESAAPVPNIDVIGGARVTRSFLGIPYSAVQAATTIDKTREIVKDLSENLESFSLNLKGFGTSGIDIGEVGGGFKIAGVLGNRSDLKKLSALCGEEKIDLYMDFDILTFSESGAGFNRFFDGAIGVGRQKITRYIYDKAIRIQDRQKPYGVLAISKLDKAVKKVIKKTDGLCGVSLSTLSSLSTSDYSDSDSPLYYSGVGFGKTVTSEIKKIKKSGRFLADSPNLYAALSADIITGVPTESSESLSFCNDVPFYQMVFRGSVPMTVDSINLRADPTEGLLSAVEGGCAPAYTVIGEWDNSLIDSDCSAFYASSYDDLRDTIIADAKRLSDYYKATGNAAIASHEILGGGVSVTTFENGARVYVNRGSLEANTPAGTVGAKDFLVWEGER